MTQMGWQGQHSPRGEETTVNQNVSIVLWEGQANSGNLYNKLNSFMGQEVEYVAYISFFQLIYFNWRIIALQYYDSFCHTSTWIGHRCACASPPSWTPLLAPSPPYPSGLSQGTSFGCPASCIELTLVICFTYSNVHVSMLFSQIIPPLPSLLSPKVCSLHLCLLCYAAGRIVSTVFLNSIYMH